MLAHKPLQRFWEITLWAAMSGLGYQNWAPAINGEDHFLRQWLKRNSRSDLVVFDVGGFEGEFTAIVLADHPSAMVHVFEPNPNPFERLVDRYRNNPRVVLNRMGLSDRKDELVLHDHADTKGTCEASFIRNAVHGQVSTVTAPLTTLDDYCQDHDVGHIDYLKVDVEGYEEKVFAGAAKLLARGAIETIHFEQNEMALLTGFSLTKICDILADFDIYRMLPKGLIDVRTKHVPLRRTYDFFRYHNLVAVRRA